MTVLTCAHSCKEARQKGWFCCGLRDCSSGDFQRVPGAAWTELNIRVGTRAAAPFCRRHALAVALVFDGALAAAVELNTPGPTSSEQLLAKGGVDKLADADAAAPLVAEKADLSSEGSGFSPLNYASESTSDEMLVVINVMLVVIDKFNTFLNIT